MKPVPGLAIEQQPNDVVLTMCLWGEARGEPNDGVSAVAWVIKNRALSRDLTVKEVCLQPRQFSCFNSNDPNRSKMLDAWEKDPYNWNRVHSIGQEVIRGEVPDPTLGASHYVTASLWATDDSGRKKYRWFSQQAIDAGITVETARIGNHVFARTA